MSSSRSLLSRLVWTLFKRETVGIDSLGNKYYRQLERQVDGGTIEKRYVKFGGGIDNYDPLSIPPEWSAWLRKTRLDAPTTDDIQQGAQAQEQQQKQAEEAAKAADLADRRFREQSSQHDGSSFKPQLGGGSEQQPR